MKNLVAGTLSAVILMLASGLTWADQHGSTDCSNAKSDLSHLQHEKKSTDERIDELKKNCGTELTNQAPF